MVVFQRRGRVDVGIHPRRRLEFLVAEAAGDAHHFHHVLDPLGAQRIGVHHLVGQGELVEQHVEMTDAGMEVHRLDRVAAGKMDAVEILRQLQQVGALLAGAGHLAADLHVPVVGRRRDIAEQDIILADHQLAVGIARGQRERGRRLAHHLHHEIPVHAHQFALDPAAGRAEDLQRLGVQEGNADLFQDAHGAVMQRGDARFVQRFSGPVQVDRQPPGHLFNHRMAAPCRVSGPAAAAPPFCQCIRHIALLTCCFQQAPGARRLPS